MININLYANEVPIVDWLDSRMNRPPSAGVSWPPGGAHISDDLVFSFDYGAADLLLDLLHLYIEMAQDDQDMNPDSVASAVSLRDKVLQAVR